MIFFSWIYVRSFNIPFHVIRTVMYTYGNETLVKLVVTLKRLRFGSLVLTRIKRINEIKSWICHLKKSRWNYEKWIFSRVAIRRGQLPWVIKSLIERLPLPDVMVFDQPRSPFYFSLYVFWLSRALQWHLRALTEIAWRQYGFRYNKLLMIQLVASVWNCWQLLGQQCYQPFINKQFY